MSTQLIAPPVEMAVSIEDARTAVRADGTELDAEIKMAVKGITADAEHSMQKSIIHQTWRCTLDGFPDAIELLHPPIVEVKSIRFYDTDGVLQTLDPADYVLDNAGEYRPGYLVPAPRKAWPATESGRINAVMVDYVAGYGANHESTPDEVKFYILAKLAERFGVAKESPYIDRLLDRQKIYGVG